MKLPQMVKKARQFVKPYRIIDGKSFRLKHVEPGDTQGLPSEARPQARELLQQGVDAMARLQEMLYAQNRWAVLLIFQAMDAAGKDGAIKHVMSGINPQGCQVHSFKAPSTEELDHDYLWRCSKRLPPRGQIGVFNRSYYEEVLVVRVHQELLQGEKLPSRVISKDIWRQRLDDIRSFEQYLTHNGVVVCKFFLHLSKGEQKNRFLERLDNPDKQWKFSAADAREREYWDDYMAAYEAMIRHTATEHAPWYVVPADNKWFTRLVVAAAIVETLSSLDLSFPRLGKAQRQELDVVRRELTGK